MGMDSSLIKYEKCMRGKLDLLTEVFKEYGTNLVGIVKANEDVVINSNFGIDPMVLNKGKEYLWVEGERRGHIYALEECESLHDAGIRGLSTNYMLSNYDRDEFYQKVIKNNEKTKDGLPVIVIESLNGFELRD